jgi:thiol:disulfide interchange protein DsbD
MRKSNSATIKVIGVYTFLLAALVVVLTAASSIVFAFGENSQKTDEVDLKDPLTASVRLQPSIVEAGGTIEVIVALNLAEKYHAYLDRLKLTIEKPDDLKLAPFKVAPLVKFHDPASKSQKTGIEGRATMRAVMEVPTGFNHGRHNISLKLIYQACTAEHCLFPKNLILQAPLIVASEIEMPLKVGGAANTSGSETDGNQFEAALKESLLSAFLLVFGVGFLTCLTPCIYPMIPITLAVLGARAHGQSHWRNFSLALAYVLGIALTYAVLGLLAASTGGFFGSALSNIWVVSGIALVFFTMGLSMFGLFEVQAPAFVRNRLGAARSTTGYSGALATGLLAGIVASPCIGPVLVSILAFIAQTQNQLLGFLLLFTFAIGMGIPFIVLGMSSSALTRLPKAGPWMEIIKVFFGFIMVGMAFYYIRPLYPVWLFHFLLGSALAGLAGFFGVFIKNKPPTLHEYLRRLFSITVLLIGVVISLMGVGERYGVRLFGPRVPQGPKHSALAWKPYSKAELTRAREMKLPVLIDFTAEWCGACQEMEEKTFPDPRIVAASQKFVLLQIDGTEDNPELSELIKEFKVPGFPTYIFYGRDGENRHDLTGLGFIPADNFLKRMNSL